MSNLLLLLFIVIVIICIISYAVSRIECFASNNTATLYTYPQSLKIKTTYISPSQLDSYVYQLFHKLPIKYPDPSISSLSFVVDPLIELKYFQNYDYDIRDLSDGFFVHISRLRPTSCTHDLYFKTIGYLTHSDLFFIKAILNGYQIDVSTVRLKQMNPNTIDLGGVDCMITYVTQDSPLFKQMSNDANYIYGFKDIDLDRVRLFYPFVKDRKTQLQFVFKSKNKVEQELTNLPTMTLRIINNISSSYGEFIREGFISRLEISPEIDDPGYQCYGMTDNENRALCNSRYGPLGIHKDYFSIWDKPCKMDSDCPFFLANKNYPNTRGGCVMSENAGVCEFPIGIKRLGYKKFDDSYPNNPFCYGCPDQKGDCCKDQQDPDYAFPNDQQERKKHGKEIIIAKL